MRRFARQSIFFAATLAVAASGLAAAAEPPAASSDSPSAAQASQAPTSGPLVLQKSDDGFVIAPEIKMTRLDGKDRALVGAYGGWLIDNRFLFGGGGYVSARNRRSSQMDDGFNWHWDNDGPQLAYGGFVIGWYAGGGPVRVGVRALVGIGRGTLDDTITYQVPTMSGSGQNAKMTTTTLTETYSRRLNFVVAEPQAEVVIKVNHWLGLTASGGYRAVSGEGGSSSNKRLRGAVGSFSVRFGPF